MYKPPTMWVFRLRTAIFAGAIMLPGVALAGEPPKGAPASGGAAEATSPAAGEPKAEALKHFERARELYRDGLYKEAIVELEAAHALDRDAKDLVYNLALVNEKLVRIDDALRWMRQYSEMDLDQAERGRAESTIRRLEGAKKTLAEQRAADEKSMTKPGTDRPTSPAMGRIDALTITAGAVSIVGLGVGSVAGVLALSQKPKAGTVTGPSSSYQQLADEASHAHTKAIVADVGFGIFVAGGAACGLLYFLRPKVEAKPSPAKPLAFVPWAAPTGGGLTVSGAL